MALGLRGVALHQINNDEAAQDRRQDHPVPEPARPLEDVGVVGDLEHAVEHGVVDEPDQRPESDRADAGHNSHPQREQAQDEEAYPSLLTVGGGDGLGRNGGICGR